MLIAKRPLLPLQRFTVETLRFEELPLVIEQLAHVVDRDQRDRQFGRFIARPFAWADGSGILLIDIDDGAWREFVTRPLALSIERRDFAPASEYPARALALRGGVARSW